MADRDRWTVADLVQVRIVWDPVLGSPPELQAYGGALVAVPPDYIPLPPQGTIFGVRGYSRQDAENHWEWVLQGAVSPVDSFVDGLTGRPGGWVNQAARTTVVSMVRALYGAGITVDTIASQFPLLVQAIAAEVVAEQQAGVMATLADFEGGPDTVPADEEHPPSP